MEATEGRETFSYWLSGRITAACLVVIFIITNVLILISVLNSLLFWYIHMGMEETLADHVHHEVI
ncbi:hypothetical protein KP509_1Z290700 [Ceratopteris richardii]|nr:hypothetical protein KP509_1Z320400 [Ceratopteris richardii]KAH6554661.1 hypothetical protein KP509_1Z316800 [Ceratopteris richardii]KAH6554995.1 hypothetical protein KP509_1Z290700 [Ceratopteris richardii]